MGNVKEKFRFPVKLLLQLNEAWELHPGEREPQVMAFAGSHLNLGHK